MPDLPRYRAAAVQAAPVFLDAWATVAKACELIATAAGEGAKLVAFPEVFLPGYPYWNWTMNPIQGSPWFEKLWYASVEIPGPEIDALCAAARAADCHVVIGVNERDPDAVGTLYNTVVFISPERGVLGRHRKLVPTWAEKLTWTGGDGSTLRVYPTELGPLGALACGENTNPLARFTLLAQGELVHIANYIALPVAPPDYDMVEAIRIRGAAHAFEGKVYSIVSCSTISPEMIAALEADAATEALLRRPNSAFSGIFGPDGRLLTEPLIDVEGIVYADIDLGRCIQPKQMHDVLGHYNRFDVFQLHVDRRPRQRVVLRDRPASSWAGRSEEPDGESDATSDLP